MGDERLKIKLDIAGKSYELEIPPHDEEVYRLAARRVNMSVAECQAQRFDGYMVQDFLAITALDVMVTNIELARSREVGDEGLQELAQLADTLRHHLTKE